MEKRTPGIKEIEIPLIQALEHIWPVLKEEPKILKKNMPIFKEILEAIRNETEIYDEKFVKWGTSLLKTYGPHLKKWIKVLREAPIQNLIDNINHLNVELEEKQEAVLNWIKDTLKVMRKLSIKNEPKTDSGFLKFLDFKIFDNIFKENETNAMEGDVFKVMKNVRKEYF